MASCGCSIASEQNTQAVTVDKLESVSVVHHMAIQSMRHLCSTLQNDGSFAIAAYRLSFCMALKRMHCYFTGHWRMKDLGASHQDVGEML